MIYQVFITPKTILLFFASYNGYNLLCSNTTLLKGLSFDRSYRSYSAERKPEIQSYILKIDIQDLCDTGAQFYLLSSQVNSWELIFKYPLDSAKTLGKMQKYGMRREWRRERKVVEVKFTDSLYEDSCFYPLGKPSLFSKFKCGPTSLSSS